MHACRYQPLHQFRQCIQIKRAIGFERGDQRGVDTLEFHPKCHGAASLHTAGPAVSIPAGHAPLAPEANAARPLPAKENIHGDCIRKTIATAVRQCC